jgi:CrcB protein
VTGPHPLRLSLLAAVALGGAGGAGARWWLTSWFPTGEHGFPWPTFAINVSGSVLLALLAASAFVRRHPALPPALGTGVLGGFTTMSAYSEETRSLLATGRTGLAAAYLMGTLAACLLGVALADRFSSTAERQQFEVEDGDL